MNTKQILALFAVLLWVSACSDSTVTNPAIQSDEVESPGTSPGVVFKHKFGHKLAAQIVYAPDGTYYECASGDVYSAKVGQYLYGGCQVWNDDGESYTLEINGPHSFILSEATTVEITNPVGVRYRIDGGHWIKVTGDITVTCEEVRVRGGGSAGMSTSAEIDIHSGRSEN